jgi:hypothetical protein
MFFFEKKNQKTFDLGLRAWKHPCPKVQKFFAELFFKKATTFLYLESL